MNKKKDFLGNDLQIGDEVIFIRMGCRELKKGIIKKMTGQMLLINDKSAFENRNIKQYPNQVINITHLINIADLINMEYSQILHNNG